MFQDVEIFLPPSRGVLEFHFRIRGGTAGLGNIPYKYSCLSRRGQLANSEIRNRTLFAGYFSPPKAKLVEVRDLSIGNRPRSKRAQISSGQVGCWFDRFVTCLMQLVFRVGDRVCTQTPNRRADCPVLQLARPTDSYSGIPRLVV